MIYIFFLLKKASSFKQNLSQSITRCTRQNSDVDFFLYCLMPYNKLYISSQPDGN